jgi:hypothetical protein
MGFLSDWAGGVRNSPSMIPGLRPEGDSGLANMLKALESFTFLVKDDVQGKQMMKGGARVAYVYYYKMRTGSDAWYFGFYISDGGKVATHLRMHAEQ